MFRDVNDSLRNLFIKRSSDTRTQVCRFRIQLKKKIYIIETMYNIDA